MCTYPADERRSARPSKAEIEALQVEVATLRKALHGEQRASLLPESPVQHQEVDENGRNYFNSESSVGGSPTVSKSVDLSRVTEQVKRPPRSAAVRSPSHLKSPLSIEEQAAKGASPSEAEIACAIEEDGSIQIHGRTSHLHQFPVSKARLRDRTMSIIEQESRDQNVKDQLFAYAALQRQRESTVFMNLRQPATLQIDFDGVPKDIALHLLDLHWNRQHFAYLLTYRPAIIDSLLSNGPYANKLLLNAIYYSSCLYSDRQIFRSNSEEPESSV